MNTDFNLPRAFEVVKDSDEEIMWVGKPNFWAFITRGIPFLCIGLILSFINKFYSTTGKKSNFLDTHKGRWKRHDRI